MHLGQDCIDHEWEGFLGKVRAIVQFEINNEKKITYTETSPHPILPPYFTEQDCSVHELFDQFSNYD